MLACILLKRKGAESDKEDAGPVYAFHPESLELLKDGVRLRFLSRQVSTLLQLLLDRQPNPATIEDIEHALWPSGGVPQESRQAIRELINNLRQLFCDSAREPHFIETIPTKGYRFVGVRITEVETSCTQHSKTSVKEQDTQHPRRWRVFPHTVVCLSILLISVIGIFSGGEDTQRTQVPRFPISRVLAGVTREPVRRIALPSTPGRSVISRDGKNLYTAFPEIGKLTVVDLIRGRVTREMQPGGAPYGLVLSPDGKKIYLGDQRDGVRILELETGESRHITTGGPVHDIEMTGDGNRLFLAMGYKGLRLIDTRDGSTAPVPGIVCPMNFARDPTTNTLWISCRCGGPGGRLGHDRIEVLDMETLKSRGPVGGDAPIVGGDIAFSPEASQVWIDGSDACSSPRYDHSGCPEVPSGVLHAFRTDGQLLKSLPVANSGALQFSPDGRFALFGIITRLYVFETSAFRLVESINTDAMMTYFSSIRPELYIVSYDTKQLLLVPLPPAVCEAPPGDARFHLAADGVGTDVYGAGHATLMGGASYSAGILGQAFHFDGRSGFVEFGKDGSYGLRIDPDWTSSFWIKPERDGTDEILSEHRAEDGALLWRVLRGRDTRIEIQVVSPRGDVQQIRSKEGAAVGVWTNLAFGNHAGTIALYFNGVLQSEMGVSIPARLGRQVRMGAGFEGGHFAGLLDEIMVRGAMSAAQYKAEFARLQRCITAKW